MSNKRAKSGSIALAVLIYFFFLKSLEVASTLSDQARVTFLGEGTLGETSITIPTGGGGGSPPPQPAIGHPLRSIQRRGDFEAPKKMGAYLELWVWGLDVSGDLNLQVTLRLRVRIWRCNKSYCTKKRNHTFIWETHHLVYVLDVKDWLSFYFNLDILGSWTITLKLFEVGQVLWKCAAKVFTKFLKLISLARLISS